MYKWLCFGTYYGGDKEIISYEEEFELSENHLGKARAIIRRGFINDRLKGKDASFKAVRECQLLEDPDTMAASGDNDKELEQLLLKAAEYGCIPMNYESYKDDKVRKTQLKRAIKKREDREKKAIEKENKDMEGMI